MKVFDKIFQLENVCLGLGFFDGVHIGHRKLISELVKKSKAINSESVILTFKKSPAEMFANRVKYLTTNNEKEKILSELGVDYVFELDFNEDLMNTKAEDYLKNIIYANFKPKYIYTGFNHTFGKNKQGDCEFLKSNQRKYNYIYEEIPPITLDGDIVSSTLIKKSIENDEIDKANQLLGYNYTIGGMVVKGNQIGRTIGFPTANINYPSSKIEITHGVYSTKVQINNKTYYGMLNYGLKPTIYTKNNKPVAEVHIIGFNSDIYGEIISVSILKKIRAEKKFKTLDELKIQINKDISECLELS